MILRKETFIPNSLRSHLVLFPREQCFFVEIAKSKLRFADNIRYFILGMIGVYATFSTSHCGSLSNARALCYYHVCFWFDRLIVDWLSMDSGKPPTIDQDYTGFPRMEGLKKSNYLRILRGWNRIASYWQKLAGWVLSPMLSDCLFKISIESGLKLCC